jgi:hypothetical protein
MHDEEEAAVSGRPRAGAGIHRWEHGRDPRREKLAALGRPAGIGAMAARRRGAPEMGAVGEHRGWAWPAEGSKEAVSARQAAPDREGRRRGATGEGPPQWMPPWPHRDRDAQAMASGSSECVREEREEGKK